jgi:hypothetical protein
MPIAPPPALARRHLAAVSAGLLAAVFGVTIAGCIELRRDRPPEGPEEEEDDGEGEGPIERSAAALVDAQVAALTTCTTDGFVRVARLRVAEPTAFGAAVADLEAELAAAAVADFDDPALVLDAEAYDACLAALAACDATAFDDHGPCDVFRGTRANGAPCARDAVCVDGSTCVEGPPGSCGTCDAIPGEGGACAEGDTEDPSRGECAEGFTCALDAVGGGNCVAEVPDPPPPAPGDACDEACGVPADLLACVEGTCAPYTVAALGEACDVEIATAVRYCVDAALGDNFCLDGGDGVGTCTRRPDVDEACSDTAPCRQDAVCADGTCVAEPIEEDPCAPPASCEAPLPVCDDEP